MKIVAALFASLTATHAFTTTTRTDRVVTTVLSSVSSGANTVETSRKVFLNTLARASTAAIVASVLPETALATGRATLDVTYRRYAPRIRAGGEFYGGDFKQLVKNNDWSGIQAALQEVPERTKKDLNKADSGVAARARQAGEFSDSRVLVAADLFASSFSSQNSVTDKTKKMKAAVASLRSTVSEMNSVVKQASGEDKGGFLGRGKKKVSEAELAQQMRTLYAQGGNAWNEYVFAANENLALQFDKFEYVS
eukprot:CAMPEP_0198138184 /NCGR_PEP_ID=MMETSP1443-20131203/1601_1 /TAXON_ID=186043 /ORGANISM="Entomoneis sp., Strain CCMP2396" /LENGTH=251 /DNA_ID=CAMNT_0043799851 /DNA_START=46 /DNA_END=801 /DNA_ORIENTATION=-